MTLPVDSIAASIRCRTLSRTERKRWPTASSAPMAYFTRPKFKPNVLRNMKRSPVWQSLSPAPDSKRHN